MTFNERWSLRRQKARNEEEEEVVWRELLERSRVYQHCSNLEQVTAAATTVKAENGLQSKQTYDWGVQTICTLVSRPSSVETASLSTYEYLTNASCEVKRSKRGSRG